MNWTIAVSFASLELGLHNITHSYTIAVPSKHMHSQSTKSELHLDTTIENVNWNANGLTGLRNK